MFILLFFGACEAPSFLFECFDDGINFVDRRLHFQQVLSDVLYTVTDSVSRFRRSGLRNGGALWFSGHAVWEYLSPCRRLTNFIGRHCGSLGQSSDTSAMTV